MDSVSLKKNVCNVIGLKSTKCVSLVKDTRKNTSSKTAKYQIALYIDSEKKFKKIQNNLAKFMKTTTTNCKRINANTLDCPISKNSVWHKYGGYSGPAKFSLLYPVKFEGKKKYNINHGVGERLIISPIVFKKPQLVKMINRMGSRKTKRKTRRKTYKGGSILQQELLAAGADGLKKEHKKLITKITNSYHKRRQQHEKDCKKIKNAVWTYDKVSDYGGKCKSSTKLRSQKA